MHHPTDRIAHSTAFVIPVVEHWLEREIAQWVHPRDVRRHKLYTTCARFYMLIYTCENIRSDLRGCARLYVLMYGYGSSDSSFIVDPLSYFLFQPVFHDWCNKGHLMYYLLCGMLHIKEPLLLIEKA